MAYEIRIVSRDSLVQIKISGPITPELVDEICPGVSTAAREYDCKRILADLQGATKHLSTLEKYHLASRLCYFGFRRTVSIAVIYSQSDSENDFFETVARNLGYRVRIFRNMKEAKDWLMGSGQKAMIATPARPISSHSIANTKRVH